MRVALVRGCAVVLIAGLALPAPATAAGTTSPARPVPAARTGTAAAAAAQSSSVVPAGAPVGGSLVPLPAKRLVDTRPSGPVRGVLVDASSQVGTGAVAAVLAITVTNPARSGYLTAYPDGATPPAAASLSFAAGRTNTGTVVANLSNTGRAGLRLAVPANVIVDLVGYFTGRAAAQAAGSYHPVTPRRFVDTRHAVGAHPLTAGASESVAVTGVAGVPATGVSAVAVNLITVGSTANGYLTAYPDGQSRPRSASLSVAAGRVVANQVFVGVGNGRIGLFNAAGTTQFVLEIVGYFGSAAGGGYYHPVQPSYNGDSNDPARVADSRRDPVRNGVLTVTQPVLEGSSGGFAPWDSTVPPIAVVAAVSVFGEQGTGSVTAFPTGSTPPATTDVPYTSGQVSNQVLAQLSHGSFSLRIAGASTQLVADMSGYFARLSPSSTAGLWGWGWNSAGRADHPSSSAPIRIAPATGVIGLSTTNWYANYLIRDDHTVWGWGYGPFGAGRTYSSTPIQVPGATSVVSVVANAPDDNRWGTAYALRSDGTVLAWGQNARGELADGSTTARNSPAVIVGLTGVTQIAAGWTAGYALKSDGTVWAWGDGTAGQLGQDIVGGYRSRPAQVPGLTGVVAIAADQNEAWAISADGSLKQWGTSYMDNGPTGPATPSWTAGACPARTVVAADQHGAVLCQDGTVWAWEVAVYQPLEHGALIPGLTGVTDLFAQDTATFALTSSGTVWRWGYDFYDSLGDGYMWNSATGDSWPVNFTAPAPMTDLTGVTLMGGFREGTFLLRG